MRRVVYIILLFGLPVSFLPGMEVGAAPAVGDSTWARGDASLGEYFDRAYALFEEEDYERSIEYWQRVVGTDASYADEDRGPAAYWFGRALEALDMRSEALAYWDSGLRSMDTLDLRLADAYVRGVFREQKKEHYSLAAMRYLEMLRHLGQPLSDGDAAILSEHLEELCLILPDDTKAYIGLHGCMLEAYIPDLEVAAGERLVSWWSGQNVNIATRGNERLEEHLERVAYARENYAHSGRIEDRGEIYIRFGPPEWRRQIRIDELSDFEFSQALTTAAGHALSLEHNEYWIYPTLHRRAHFLFVWDRNEGYRLADATELIPPSLTAGSRRAPMAITVMEYVYRQLSLHAHDYVGTYNDVADYKDRLKMEGTFGRLGGPGDVSLPARTFVQSAMAAARDRDVEIRERREEEVPPSRSNVGEDVEYLSGAVRMARFLDEDGLTRTEVYWGTAIEALEPTRLLWRVLEREDIEDVSEGYLVMTTLVRQSETFEEQERKQQHQRVGPFAEGEEQGVLVPQTYEVPGDTSAYRIAAQWDQYVLYRDEGEVDARVGPQLKVQRYRSEAMEPLSSDPRTLEMSDLKPLLFIGTDERAPIEEQSVVYPYERIMPDTQLALYFEVYNLIFGDDDQTRFTVEYDVKRERQPGALGRLLGRGSRVERTTVRSEYVNESRRAEEYVILDLAELDAEQAKNVEVTVRVRDEVTGQESERSVAFHIVEVRSE